MTTLTTGAGGFSNPDFQPLDDPTPDPKGIAILPNGNVAIASERDADGDPAIYEVTRDGVLVGEFAIDPKFVPDVVGEGRTRGVRDNLGFESLTVSPDASVLTYATERALVQDGPTATLDNPGYARIVQADAATGEVIAEYAYEVDPIATAPVETATLDDRGCTGKVYLVRTQGATDISGVDAIPLEEDEGAIGALVDELAQKDLIADLGADFGIEPDNIEARSLIPTRARMARSI